MLIKFSDRFKSFFLGICIGIPLVIFRTSPKASIITFLVLMLLVILNKVIPDPPIRPLKNIEHLKLDNVWMRLRRDILTFLFMPISLYLFFILTKELMKSSHWQFIVIFILLAILSIAYGNYINEKTSSLKFLKKEDKIREVTFEKASLQFIINKRSFKLKDITSVTFEIEEAGTDVLFYRLGQYGYTNNACVHITFSKNDDFVRFKVPNFKSVNRIKEILQLYHIGINYLGYCESESTQKLLGWGEDIPIKRMNRFAKASMPREKVATINEEVMVRDSAPKNTISASNNQELFGHLVREDSKLYVLCPNCGMKYGAEINADSKIAVRNFEDEDLNQQGQQIMCIKCGQEFTVPQK